MNRIVTSALGMLVIAGVLYRPPATDVGPTPGTQSPKASPGAATHQQPGSTAQAEEAPGKQPQSAIGNNPCFDTSGPWDKIPEFFGEKTGKNEQGAPNRFKGNLEEAYKIERNNQYQLQYLISTLADPVHTNLELYFDRGIEAILRAASESGYDFDRYWLPWSSEALPEESNCYWRGLRDLNTKTQQKMPGLLLFRRPEPPGKTADGKPKPPQLLFVFLVAETPTSGIDKEQFVNAVRYVQEIRDTGHAFASDVIPLLGPTFSGSVDSLILAVNAAESQRVGPRVKFRVSSGSITNRDAVAGLQNRKEIQAGTTVADDCAALTGFNQFLLSQGTQGGQVALISEDGTAYGRVHRQSEAPCLPPGFLELLFPRKMAVLREAYQANPQVGAPGGSQQVSLPRRLLPLSLTESAQSEEDAVPVFSKQQTPIAQESQVMALASTLREKNIKYAGIMASDPLDTAFLIRFLHRSAPDVRLLVREADLLFLRALEDDTAPLGLLAVTSYPLLTASQEWLSQGSGAEGKAPRVFTSQYAEATYNSCLLLLNEKKADARVRDANWASSQLSQASDLSLNPPLWLMMAGHSSYWPVTLLPGGTEPISLNNEKLPRAWVLVWGLVSCLALCHALAIIFAHCANYRWLEQSRLSGEGTPRKDAEKAFYLLVATLAVLAIEALLLYAPRRLELLGPWQLRFASFVTGTLVVAAGLLVVVATGLAKAIETFFFDRILPSPPWHLPKWYSSLTQERRKPILGLLLTLVVIACTWVFCHWHPWSWGGGGPYNYRAFFWYRSIHLTSGVSPVVPLCFLAGALYAWAWMSLKCTATAARQPGLWPSILLKPFVDADRKLRQGIGKPLYDWKIALAVFALTVLTFLALGVRKDFTTPESSLFSEVYIAGLALLCFLLFSNWAKFLVIWSGFRRVLEGFDQLPLRAAFRRLPRQYSWSPIWEHGGTRQGYEVLIRWFDNLQKLASVTGSGILQEYYKRNWGTLRQIAEQVKAGGAASASMDELQAGLLETTNFIDETYLKPEWAKGKSDSLTREAEASWTEEARQEDFDANKNRILAEESLALYYLRYIRNVCLYLRYLVFFISTGFILVLISLKSYPFQAEHTISLAITAVFALLGIGVIWVFVEMEKDPVLSCLADTKEGKLSGGFYLRLISYGALPLFTFIAAQFPSVARFFFSWIQPSLTAFK